MGKPAARVGDMHTCPMYSCDTPHVGGPMTRPSVSSVLIGGQHAAFLDKFDHLRHLKFCAVVFSSLIFSGFVFAQDSQVKIAWSAIERGQTEIVESLLDKGLDIDEKDKLGNTLLMSAVFRRKPPIVELLLTRGASVKAANQGGVKALTLAVAAGDVTIVRLLLKYGAKIQSDSQGSKLLMTVRMGHEDITRILIDEGADLDEQDNCGLTPLIVASAFGSESIVKMLLDAGADVDKGTKRFFIYAERRNGITERWDSKVSGITALMFAAAHGNAGVLLDLVKAGVDIYDKDLFGNTAKDYAIKENNHEIVALLDSVSRNKNFVALLSTAAYPSRDSAAVDKEPGFIATGSEHIRDSLKLQRTEDHVSSITLRDTRTGGPYLARPINVELRGTIVLRVLVDAHGNPRQAYTTFCSYDFMPTSPIKPALNAVRGMKFTPAMRGGKPVIRWTTVTLSVDRSLPY